MDLESQMAFTTRSRATPKASPSDLLTEILFSFSPAFMYQWVEDYGRTGQGDVLETVPHLTHYWNNVFRENNIAEGEGLFNPAMSEERWLQTFTEQALPILRNNRKLFSHERRH